ncbi:hypothetical protein WEI85_25890 [Actinomycetes bacterium KLBMP 9797]
MFDRKARGPLITLLVGLVFALVLGALSANAATEDASGQAQAPAATPPPATSAPPPPATSAPPPPTAPPTAAPAAFRAAYAGRVDGGAASIAIAVRDGGAIAYVCDGRRIEAWMLGTATDGNLNLSGEGSSLTGTFDKDSAEGTVRAGGKSWTFTSPVAKKPSGLYRSTAEIRNARVVTGWIVLPGGDQVGIANTDGTPAPAPRLDVSDGTATVNGAEVTADSIDGTSSAGFR